jgi:hypothetical protein
MSWITENYLWDFYPNLKWQLIIMFFIGIFLFHHFFFQYIFIFLIILGTLLFRYRKHTPTPRPTHSIQVCNIDGTCRTIASNAFSDKHDILSPIFGFVKSIKSKDSNVIINLELYPTSIHSIFSPVKGTLQGLTTSNLRLIHPTDTLLLKLSKPLDRLDTSMQTINRNNSFDISNNEPTCNEINVNIDKGDYIGFDLGLTYVEITVPKNTANIVIKPGDKVNGYETVIAKWLI